MKINPLPSACYYPINQRQFVCQVLWRIQSPFPFCDVPRIASFLRVRLQNIDGMNSRNTVLFKLHPSLKTYKRGGPAHSLTHSPRKGEDIRIDAEASCLRDLICFKSMSSASSCIFDDLLLIIGNSNGDVIVLPSASQRAVDERFDVVTIGEFAVGRDWRDTSRHCGTSAYQGA